MAAKTRAAAKPSSHSPPPWPAAQVESWSIDRLIPYARNARSHSTAQVAQIAASMREFGWTVPVLCDEAGRIIAGHGRVLAARLLNHDALPVLVAHGWTETQKQAYTLVDNQLALNAGWDFDLLRVELTDLQEQAFDISMLGFPDEEFARILGRKSGLTDPDEAPEPPLNPRTRPGDVWLLADHRLVCGDSTTTEAIVAAMRGEPADLCLTDPPYGLGDTLSIKNNYDLHDDTRENLAKLISDFLPLVRGIAKTVVVTPGNGNQALYPPPTWTMAWFTPAGVGRGPWGFCCWQPILCFGKDPKLAKRKGCHPDAIVHTESAEKNGHPCAKPVNFWAWLMERGSERGELIYDPFSGSGTTIIAAEMTGRACHAIELSPAYVDVAVERWQAFTGKDATREADGKVFRETEPTTTARKAGYLRAPAREGAPR